MKTEFTSKGLNDLIFELNVMQASLENSIRLNGFYGTLLTLMNNNIDDKHKTEKTIDNLLFYCLRNHLKRYNKSHRTIPSLLYTYIRTKTSEEDINTLNTIVKRFIDIDFDVLPAIQNYKHRKIASDLHLVNFNDTMSLYHVGNNL